MFAILRKIYVDISTHVFPMLSGDLNLPDQTVELSDQIVKLLRHVVKHSDPYHITLLSGAFVLLPDIHLVPDAPGNEGADHAEHHIHNGHRAASFPSFFSYRRPNSKPYRKAMPIASNMASGVRESGNTISASVAISAAVG